MPGNEMPWVQRFGAVMIGLLMPVTGAMASETTKITDVRNELSLLGTYIDADSDRGADYGIGVKALFGHRLSKHWFAEAHAFANNIETTGSVLPDTYQQGVGLDLSYRFRPQQGLSPFVLAGGGVSRTDAGRLNQEQLGGFANVGVGLLTPEMTSLRMRFRAEGRYMHDTFQNDRNDAHFSVGLTVPLGVTRERVVERVRTEEKIVYRERELVDSDNDGVVNQKDECPDTIEGLAVNNRGCVEQSEEQSIVLQGVTFELNSARLTVNAKGILRRAADSLRQQEDLKIEIGGHTDSQGSAEYNRKLSQRRADAVVNFFVDNGIDVSRLNAVGYGETRPAFSNQTESGRERNRRVELSVKAQ